MAATKDLKSILSKLTHADGAKVAEQIGEQTQQLQARMVGIRRKLAILSGKGGVGKSMTTVNLALAFARQDQQVAILDVDLNGLLGDFRTVRVRQLRKNRFQVFSSGLMLTTEVLVTEVPEKEKAMPMPPGGGGMGGMEGMY